ncbi:hypothetical protein MTO96_002104 [Rhipicephalus appendiculatus]
MATVTTTGAVEDVALSRVLLLQGRAFKSSSIGHSSLRCVVTSEGSTSSSRASFLGGEGSIGRRKEGSGGGEHASQKRENASDRIEQRRSSKTGRHSGVLAHSRGSESAFLRLLHRRSHSDGGEEEEDWLKRRRS